MTALRTLLFAVLTAILLTSCGCGHEPRTIDCGEVVYVDSFPAEYRATDLQRIPGEFIGAVDMVASDSVAALICQGSDRFLSLYSIPSGKPLTKLCAKGQGPDEFADMPTNFSLTNDNDSLYVGCFDYARNILYTINATAAIDGKTENLYRKRSLNPLKDIKDILPMNDSTFFIVQHAMFTGNYPRLILSGDSVKPVENLGRQYEDWSGVNWNTIAFFPLLSPSGSEVAEGMIRLNQINLYSLEDPDFRKTIVVGDELDDVIYADSRRNHIRRYIRGQALDSCFVMLYSGVDKETFHKGEGESELQFFSWDGRPLMRVTLPVVASSFHIDSSGENIYIFAPGADGESLYRCDVP